MNKVFLLFFLVVFTVSLEAYSKKVILASFSTETRAQKMINELPKVSPSVISLAKKYNFKLKIRKSGKYYILVAEVFNDKKVLKTSLKEIRRRFKGAYVGNYKPSDSTAQTKVQTKIEKAPKLLSHKKRQETTNIALENKPKAKEKKIEVVQKEILESKTQIIEKEVNQDSYIKSSFDKQLERFQDQFLIAWDIFKTYFEWTYFILFIVFIVFVRYYIKFKRIYDEY